MTDQKPSGEIVLFQRDADKFKIQASVDGQTVWLLQGLAQELHIRGARRV